MFRWNFHVDGNVGQFWRICPENCALFGLVSYNNPCKSTEMWMDTTLWALHPRHWCPWMVPVLVRCHDPWALHTCWWVCLKSGDFPYLKRRLVRPLNFQAACKVYWGSWPTFSYFYEFAKVWWNVIWKTYHFSKKDGSLELKQKDNQLPKVSGT